jgi:xylulokinase
VKLGGAGDILCCVERVQVDARLFLDYHVIPGKFLINGCMAASGSLIRWYRDQFAPQSDYAALDAEAALLPAGSEGLIVLPYFLGEKTPINDPLARGTVVGLTLSHTRSHLYRAILEGIAYGFYHHLTVIAEQLGLTGVTPKDEAGGAWPGGFGQTKVCPTELFSMPISARVTNGGAGSALWRQITADVLGLRLEQISGHPGSSLGAAFVAGMGVGLFSDWGEIERFIRIASVTEPNPEDHERYQKLFGLYREIYEALKDKFPVLAGI